MPDEKIYKSTHKGAQIDEAVETVLTNECKIKWGNIAEGDVYDQPDLWGQLEAKVPKTTTINGHDLSTNLVLTPADIHALPEETVVGRYIAMNDLKIVLKDKDNNVISEATISSYNKNALDTLFAGKSNIDLDNLTATGEAHFANPSLNNLDVVGQQLINSKLNKANVTSKGDANNPVYFNENGVAVPIDETFALQDLSNVTDIAQVRVVVQAVKSGKRWFRLYDDKWCEQGGTNNGAVTFTKPFVDTNYTVLTSGVAVSSKSTTGCNIGGAAGWVAMGYVE